MAKNPTQVLQSDPDETAKIGSRRFPEQILNLKIANAVTRIFPVAGLTHVSARINASDLATSVVEMKKSIDGVNATSFRTPITFSGTVIQVFAEDLEGAAYVVFETITDDAAASDDALISV